MKELTSDEKRDILQRLIDSKELYVGGIPSDEEEYLQAAYGLTRKQFDSVCTRLYRIIKSLK